MVSSRISVKVSPRHLLCWVVVAGLLAATVSLPDPPRVRAATGAVTGFVFQDFDSDGTYDSTSVFGQAKDIPLADITVRAFDATGVRVATARTGSDGNYFLDLADVGVTNVRVEFSWPTTDPYGTMKPSFIGPNNGGSIQFVSAGATNVNFALNAPEEFCQNNPNICVTRQIWNISANSAASPSIFVSNYNSGPLNAQSNSSAWYNDWTKTKTAQFNLTGSVHGTAWDTVSRKIYTAAYVRRGVAMYESPVGTPRPGAIFVSTPTATDSTGTGGTSQFLVDLETLIAGDQFSNSTAPPTGVANAGFTGYIPPNSQRGLSLTGVYTGGYTDADVVAGQNGVWEEVGRTGIGDIDTDAAGNLWVVSMYDKNLYKVTLKADGSAPTTMASVGSIAAGMTCTGGVARPFGVTSWRGDMFVGVVCDGSTSYIHRQWPLYRSKDLTFTVRKYDTATNTWSTYFGPQNLYAVNGAGVVQPFKGTGSGASETANEGNTWNAWTTEWDGYNAYWGQESNSHPIPALSDIEFDRDGSMILGFHSMTGDMFVMNGYTSPGGGSEQNFTGPGDIYRVCRTGTGFTPTDYVFEGGTGCARTGANVTTNTYDDEYYTADEYGASNGGHNDVSLGMTEQVPGFSEVLFTAFDPYNTNSVGQWTWNSGGVKYASNTTGGQIAVSGLVAPSGGLASGVMYVTNWSIGLVDEHGYFGKTNSMGDIESLCDQAPVQIGNRVWNDADGDGIQDPGEAPIVGATVHLYNSAGTLVGTAITDANGNYYFNSNTTEAAAGTGDNVGGGLTRTDTFTLKMDKPSDYTGSGPLAALNLTTAGATTTVTTDTDVAINSDATLTGTGSTYGVNSFPTISVPVQGAGNNNQTYDFGFAPPATKVSVGGNLSFDANGNGVLNGGEVPLAGATMTLTDMNGNPVTDVYGNPVSPVVTDSNGNYTFNNLPTGQYKVTPTTMPAGYSLGTPLAGFATSSVLSTNGASDSTLNFLAVKSSVSVGNLVWNDLNRDGNQDPGEPGLVGVPVTLTDMNGNPVIDVNGNVVAATTTDANGNYVFNNLPPGQYKVSVATPTGFTPTVTGSGSTSVDSSTGTATSANLTTSGTSDMTLDFGFVSEKVSVGDFVWADTDRDGVQDAGEPGISGVVMTIKKADGTAVTDVYGNPVTATVTDANGRYVFADLPPGQYVVTAVTPTGYTPTTSGAGTSTTDSSTGSATSTNLTTNGATDTSLDFGFILPAVSVGNLVWVDTDRDGIQDAGEPGIAGVNLTITKADGTAVTDVYGNAVTTTTTDANGNYTFANLPVGQYKVTVTPPAGYVATVTGAGTSTTDSSTGAATSTNLTTSGASDTSLDFGFVKPMVSVGDYVWADTNRDGIQTAGESGIAGVTLTITKADGTAVTDVYGNAVTTTTTDANGRYSFDNLPVGSYKVTVTPPAGYIATVTGAGTSTTDSSTTNATSANLTTNGASDTSLDFGFVKPMVSVGDFVWFDTDHDGVQDVGEPGMSGVKMTITMADGVSPVTDVFGNPVGAVYTDANGNYTFANLPVGQYVVTATTPTGMQATVTGAGTSTTDSSMGTATSTNLTTNGASDPSLDFGFWAPPATVGSRVWYDLDGDGIQDSGEPGMAGVTLTLSDSQGRPVTNTHGQPVGPVVTDASGNFSFTDLPLNETYTVTITYPAGTTPSPATQGSDPAIDSSTTTATSGLMDANHLLDLSLDFGVIVPHVSVGDFVWLDTDRDGVQDGGEPGLFGVTLTITKFDGTAVTDIFGNAVTTTTTDATGHYSFDNLPLGQYKVTVTPPAGYVATTSGAGTGATDSSNESATSVNLTVDGQRDPTLDFGFVKPKVSVGDFVWVDTDRDGVQDAGEPGIEGVTLTITKADGSPVTDIYGNRVTTTTTDANGHYVFDNLPLGQYKVTVTPPAGYVATTAGAGTGATDSSTGSATSSNLTTNGASDPTLDFGFVRAAVSVGEFVWSDSNRDGVQNAGEPGIAGVVMTITKADGTAVTDVYGNPVTTTTTDANGHYVFENLPTGQYTVTAATPVGYTPTVSGQGASATDSSVGSATSSYLVSNGASDTTLDFGFVTQIIPSVSVGNFVWSDTDHDGVQDVGEAGIAGVTLTITKADGTAVTNVNGNPVTTTTTDNSGHYSFDNLPPGSYKVTVTPPSGYVATVSGAGTTSTDSSTGSATSVNLTMNGQRDATLDFGFWSPPSTAAESPPASPPTTPTAEPRATTTVVVSVSVGDYVWLDANRDGVQDAGEAGIAGVTLTITKADGTPVTDVNGKPVTTTTTDNSGHYSFDNLPPGSYTVTVTPPAGVSATVPGAGTTTSDSSTGSATSVNLTENGQRDPSLDFGFVTPVVPNVEVGGRTWFDANGNGVQDAGDVGVAGAVLRLYDEQGRPARDVNGKRVPALVTGPSGKYKFTNLPIGKYSVKITYPRSMYPTHEGRAGRTKDSSTKSARSLALKRGGESDTSLDFGVVRNKPGVKQPLLPATL